jgi:YesN/AraC family two-component response regulator
VLIVDDQPLAVDYVHGMIDWARESFQVPETAGDGIEALERIDQVDPDLVLVDVVMPRADGITLAATLQRRRPRTMIVALSSFRQFDYVREIMAAGASQYVLKHELSPSVLAGILADCRRQRQADLESYVEILRGIVAHGDLLTQQDIATIRFAGERAWRHNDRVLFMKSIDNRSQSTLDESMANAISEVGDIRYCGRIDDSLSLVVARPSQCEIEEARLTPDRVKLTLHTISMCAEGNLLIDDPTKLLGAITSLHVLATHTSIACVLNVNEVYEAAKEIETINSLPHRSVAERAERFIDNHFSDQIGTTEVAKAVGVSVGHLCELFKREVGTTVLTRIQLLRIERAKTLLRDTSLSVGAVAELVGYASSRYFASTFKKHVGTSPSLYRAALQDH